MLELVWLIPALPLAGFLLLVVGGRKLGEPLAGWLATLMCGGAFAATVVVFVGLLNKSEDQRRQGRKDQPPFNQPTQCEQDRDRDHAPASPSEVRHACPLRRPPDAGDPPDAPKPFRDTERAPLLGRCPRLDARKPWFGFERLRSLGPRTDPEKGGATSRVGARRAAGSEARAAGAR